MAIETNVFYYVFRYKYTTITVLLVLAAALLGHAWAIIPLIAGVIFVWYQMEISGFTRREKKYFAERNRHYKELGIDHWEDWDRCVNDAAELASAGLSDEDIRREILLGGKHPRHVAAAVIEFAESWASIPWPRPLPKLLSSREEALHAKLKKEADEELDEIVKARRQQGDRSP